MIHRMHSVRTAVLIFLAALAAHYGALSAGWIWDDADYITSNPSVHSFDSLLTVWLPGSTPQYYPLVFTSFWMEYSLVGASPFLYHLTNLLLHAGAAILLWRILLKLDVPGAAWIAAIFAVHPMGVESIAWATERKNTLSMFLALSSILVFQRATNEKQRGGVMPHAAAFALFVAALLSKTTAVFVAPVLVLIHLRDGRGLRDRRLLATIPYFVVGAAMGLLTAYIERTHVGATGSEFDLTILDRLLLAARNLVFYITRFVFPREQVFIYPRTEIDASSAVQWLPLLMMSGVLAGCIASWRRSRAPLLILLWLCAALFPALGFVAVWPFRFSFVADHFAYAALPALATGLVLSVRSIARSAWSKPFEVGYPASAFVALCIPLSWIASQKYADAETLWRDTIARNPDAWIAHNNLATELLARAGESVAVGDRATASALAEESLPHARTAEELKPTEVTHPANQAEALFLLERHDEALGAIDRAILIAPHLQSLHARRGAVLEALARPDDAVLAYAIAAKGDDPQSRFESLLALRRLAIARMDGAAAIAHARELVEMMPGNADLRADLGAILLAQGDADAGRQALLDALVGGGTFTSERAMVAASVRYLRSAITAELPDDERSVARNIVAELMKGAPSDPVLRYFQLALDLRSGDDTARDRLASLARGARDAGADALAAEIEAFLSASAPRERPDR